jgi:RNA polymerase sigma-70 factor (ECF subfamily)
VVDRLQVQSVLERHFARPATADDVSLDRPADATAEDVFSLVYRQMRKLAGHRDFEELVQAAAEQAIRGLPAFRGKSRLSTWTFRICYLTVRKHDRWYRRWLRRFVLTGDGETPEVAAGAPDAEAVLTRAERLSRLRFAMDRLSAKRRAVVVLHDIEGLSVEETAEVVEVAAVVVRSRLRDGRKALVRMLMDDPYFGDDACRGKAES